jgi:hypothetical protein
MSLYVLLQMSFLRFCGFLANFRNIFCHFDCQTLFFAYSFFFVLLSSANY